MYPSYNQHIWRISDVSKDTTRVCELITNYCPNSDFLSVHTLSHETVIFKDVNFTYLEEFLLKAQRCTSVSISVSLIKIRIDRLPIAYLQSTAREFCLKKDNVVFENRQCLVNMYIVCVPGSSELAWRWWKT